MVNPNKILRIIKKKKKKKANKKVFPRDDKRTGVINDSQLNIISSEIFIKNTTIFYGKNENIFSFN